MLKRSTINLLFIVFGLLFFASSQAEEKKTTGEYLGAKTATHPSWFKESFLDLEEDIADAAEADKRLVVFFAYPAPSS